MAFTKVTDPTNNISNLANQPVESPSVLKQKFDEIGQDLKTYINNTLTVELESITDGDSGLDNIGMTPIAGLSATNPQEALEEITARTPINIADNSITNLKLVADVKVGSLASLTTTNKSSTTAAINEIDATIKSGTVNDSNKWDGWLIYNSFEEISIALISATSTPQEVADAMPAKSRLKAYIPGGNPNFIASTAIVITAEKTNIVETEFEIVVAYSGGEHIVKSGRYFNNGAGLTQWTGWKDVILNSPIQSTIVTGFASGWSGSINSVKNFGKQAEIKFDFLKSTDITAGVTLINAVPLAIAPAQLHIILVSMYDTAGFPLAGSFANILFDTNGEISIYPVPSTNLSTARRISAITFKYDTIQ